MAKAPPSFDFYYNDFVAGTRHLDLLERACYLELLIFQWQNGHIPKDQVQRMNLCGIVDVGLWERIWEHIEDKFDEVEGGKLANERMARDRVDAIARWESRKKAAAKARSAKREKEPPSAGENVSDSVDNNVSDNTKDSSRSNVSQGRGKREREVISNYSSIRGVDTLEKVAREAFCRWCDWRADRLSRPSLDGITLESIALAFVQTQADKGAEHVAKCVQHSILEERRGNIPWWEIFETKKADAKSGPSDYEKHMAECKERREREARHAAAEQSRLEAEEERRRQFSPSSLGITVNVKGVDDE